ncbi:metal-sulfur cluster assembly factor [Georgenia sp. AZ-5]|uniref:metal-sulfur cluster assembly factor n=1 Tax=Georgenia sp. AZ-5 TaxID=3367526 RepID=UPI003754C8C4
MRARKENEMPVLDSVNEVLDSVYDPCSAAFGCALSLNEMGLVRSVEVDGSHVTLTLRLTEPNCMYSFRIEEEIRARLESSLPGYSIDIQLYANFENPWSEEDIHPEARTRLQEWRRKRYANLPIIPVHDVTVSKGA